MPHQRFERFDYAICHTLLKRGLNSLSDDKILSSTKLKAFAHNKFNVAQMTTLVSDREENIVGKGETAGYQQFLLFPTMFSKAFSCKAVKTRDCLGKN